MRRLSRHSSGRGAGPPSGREPPAGAGSTVIEPSTAIATTRIEPMASELKVALPTTNRPGHRRDDRAAGHQDRVARTSAPRSPPRRIVLALGALLALALEVEERVVDADRHADQHDHAGDRGVGGDAGATAAASRPRVAATLVPRAAPGCPAAIRAPKATPSGRSVTGGLIVSAEPRSSATRSLMAASTREVTGLWHLEVREGACTSLGHGLDGVAPLVDVPPRVSTETSSAVLSVVPLRLGDALDAVGRRAPVATATPPPRPA